MDETKNNRLMLEKLIEKAIKDNKRESVEDILQKSDRLVAILLEKKDFGLSSYKIIVPLKSDYLDTPLLKKGEMTPYVVYFVGQVLGSAIAERASLNFHYNDYLDPFQSTSSIIYKTDTNMGEVLLPVYKNQMER